jgi:hypothetical protein
MTRRVAFYLQVSTGEQTTLNQLRELEAVAGSGVGRSSPSTRTRASPAPRAETSGPSSTGCSGMPSEGSSTSSPPGPWTASGAACRTWWQPSANFGPRGVDLFLHQQAVDTTTPSGRAMFHMLGVFAEFERAMIQDRVKAGLARVRAAGKTLGRPRVSTDEQGILEAVRSGLSIRKTAKLFGVSPAKVQRLLAT